MLPKDCYEWHVGELIKGAVLVHYDDRWRFKTSCHPFNPTGWLANGMSIPVEDLLSCYNCPLRRVTVQSLLPLSELLFYTTGGRVESLNSGSLSGQTEHVLKPALMLHYVQTIVRHVQASCTGHVTLCTCHYATYRHQEEFIVGSPT